MGRRQPGIDERVARFWAWWPTARNRAFRDERGVASDDLRALRREVDRLDKHLSLAISDGERSKHLLIVSPHADPRLKPLARAWLAAAPRADAVWEYAASRPPSRVIPHRLEDLGVDLAETRTIVNWDAVRERANLVIWHPSFHAGSDGDPRGFEARVCLAFLELLGEDDLERWVGRVSVGRARAGLPAAEVMPWIRELGARATGEVWVSQIATDQKGRFVVVRFNAALKRIDHPDAGHHVSVALYRGTTNPPGSAEAPAIQSALRELARGLGRSAIEVASVTEERRLTIHFVTGEPGKAASAAGAWASANRALRPEVTVVEDARWAFRNTYGGGGERGPVQTAPTVTTAPIQGPLYRRAKWIVAHPWRMVGLPLLVAIAGIALAAVAPSMTQTAALVVLAAFSVGGVTGSLVMLSSTYIDLRDHPVLGLVWLILHGWRGFVVFGVSVIILFVVVAYVLR